MLGLRDGLHVAQNFYDWIKQHDSNSRLTKFRIDKGEEEVGKKKFIKVAGGRN